MRTRSGSRLPAAVSGITPRIVTFFLAAPALTVSVLSRDGSQTLLSQVNPGDSLSSININDHPSLKLKVEMSSDTAGKSPELFDWSLLVAPGTANVYLPLVIK